MRMDYFFNFVRTELGVSKQAMYRNARVLTHCLLSDSEIQLEAGCEVEE